MKTNKTSSTQQLLRDIVDVVYPLAEIASKKLPMLDKDFEKAVAGAFEKKFAELNKAIEKLK